MRALCVGQPPEHWDTGNEGNRLALALCRVCPARDGETCLVGEPDRRPFGVTRAAVAYNERGGRCDLCACGYPIDELPDVRRHITECRRCRTPRLRSWDRTFHDRRTYFAAQWRKRKARSERLAVSGLPVGVLAGDATDVLSGVAGDGDQVTLPAALDERGVADGVGQLAAPALQRRLGAAVGADGGRHRVVGHGPSVTDTDVATQGLRTIRDSA